MTETRMQNPYEALYTAKEVGVLAGARVDAAGDPDTLEHRLLEMAFYLTENMQTGADALFIQDIHSAVRALRTKSAI